MVLPEPLVIKAKWVLNGKIPAIDGKALTELGRDLVYALHVDPV